jgi:methionine-rich copper-binding protein CopC
VLSILGSFALLSWAWRAAPSSLTRGPYLQNVTAQTATVVCRTDSTGSVTLRYGRQPGPPWDFETSSASGTTHVLTLTGLRPETRYDYELVSGSVQLAGGPSCFFRTAPPEKSRAPFSFLAWGDSGTGSSTQLDVAARMEEVLPAPSFALGLGDLVYESGAASAYDPRLFTPYEGIFPHVTFWPTLGNHDVETSSGAPYFDAFYLPTNTGAPGHPSNTERYYSFDHGMAHFTCLDSELSSSSPGSAMYDWLDDDLADARSRGKRWLIVFMHRPVYSHGTHDSDTESSLISLREDLVPLFDNYDVDLAAFGHSHNYERSFLARNDAILQSDDSDYSKISSPDGTIYMVSGCGGKTGGGSLDHPLMSVSYGNTAGFTRIDVRWEELRGTFTRRDGTVGDLFTVHKANDTLAPRILAVEARASDEVAVVFDEPVKDGTGSSGSENLSSYSIQPSRSVSGATRQPDERTVVLTTSTLQTNRAYQIRVSHVQDLAGNAVESFEGLWFTLPSASAGPPLPVLASEVHTANGPATIAFSSTRSSDDDGALSSVRWDFGDGSPVAQGTAVQHEYDVTGFFNANLIVTDAGGLESVAQWPIRIHSQGSAPVANLSAPSSAQTGQNVSFGSSGSSDPDGGSIVLGWDFGDPTSASNHSNATSPTHAYASAGTYTVVLAVVDDEGSTATDTSVITIGGGSQDTTPPQVTSRSPAPNATGVAATTNVTATFSEPVQGVSGSTFTLRQGSNSVNASVSYDSGTRTATLDPSSNLTDGATYTASLTSGVRDLAGNALAALSWNFTVGSSSGGDTDVFVTAGDAFVRSNNTTSNAGSDPALRLRAGDPEYRSFLRFQVSGLTGNVTSATLRVFCTDESDDGGSVYGVSTSWTESGITWSNAPALSGSPLDSLGAINSGTWAEYDVTTHVTGDGTYAFGLSSASGNSVYFSSREGANPPQLVISTSTPPPDTTPPQVTNRSPASGATGVSATTNVTATFNESVQGVSGSTFTLRQGSTNVSATVTYDDASHTATLDPSSSLAAGGTYTASLTSGIRDLGGNALAALSWSFTVAGSGSQGSTFVANADAQVRSSTPTTNLGTDPALRLRAGDPEYRSFVRFQVSGLSGSVVSATLRLFCTDEAPDGGAVYGVSTSWTESGITWNNAPALSGSPLDSIGAVSANAWAEYDVTDAVSGDGTYAFGLSSASENSAYFSAREGANPPQLVIVVGAPADTTPPQVSSRSPGSGATGVPAATNVTATFDEPVQGVSGSSFTLRQGSTSVAASVSYDSATRTATLDPTSNLAAGATYTASLTSGIRDLAGNALSALSWSFTIASSGSSSTFVTVADAMVNSNTPTRNLGSDPTLRIRAGDPEYRTFVRFQVSGLTGSVTSATLRLFVTDGSDDAGTAYEVSTSWSESGITWDNAPALSGTPLDSAGAVNANAWAEYDVTDAVSGDGTYAFGLSTTKREQRLLLVTRGHERAAARDHARRAAGHDPAAGLEPQPRLGRDRRLRDDQRDGHLQRARAGRQRLNLHAAPGLDLGRRLGELRLGEPYRHARPLVDSRGRDDLHRQPHERHPRPGGQRALRAQLELHGRELGARE